MKIRPTKNFLETFHKLDPSEKKRVAKTVRKLEMSLDWLGKRMNGDLHDARSLRTGHANRLRIVYLVNEGTGLLLIVGERENSTVYKQAAQLLRELEL